MPSSPLTRTLLVALLLLLAGCGSGMGASTAQDPPRTIDTTNQQVPDMPPSLGPSTPQWSGYPPTPTFDPLAPTWTPSLPPPPPTTEDGKPGPTAPPGLPPQGMPAIHPTIKDASPDEPAFTADDVRRYHEATNPDGHFTMRGQTTGPVTLDRITFLRDSELNALHPGLGTNSNRLVCYVEYSGTFQVISPFSDATPPLMHHAVEVYEAHTGNLLAQGIEP